MPSVSPKILNLNQDTPQKNWVSSQNLFKIEVVLTPLEEMLVLQKTLVTWPHVQCNLSHVIKFCW